MKQYIIIAIGFVMCYGGFATMISGISDKWFWIGLISILIGAGLISYAS